MAKHSIKKSARLLRVLKYAELFFKHDHTKPRAIILATASIKNINVPNKSKSLAALYIFSISYRYLG